MKVFIRSTGITAENIYITYYIGPSYSVLEHDGGGKHMAGMMETLGGIFRGKDDDSLLFFFLLLVIIFCNCGLFDDGDELLFFFLLLILLFGGGSFFRGFGTQGTDG
jgi:hypothetical protein